MSELPGRVLLWRGAALAALGALLSSEGALSLIFSEGSFADGGVVLAQRGRLLLIGLSGALFFSGWAWPGMDRRVALVSLSVLLPVFGFEALAGPFVGRNTTIFVRDADLGWRLRPGARDVWLGATVVVNSRGMRGEEELREGFERVLFLGDSVVFGAFIESDSDTFVAQAERRFVADGHDIQCLNGGVGGWAPWQERAWYERVGERLNANVVIINLVLNDVTEPLVLERHGGIEQGFQLDRSREPGWWSGTSWAHALRRWRRSAAGDAKRTAAAESEALGVYELLSNPSLPDSRRAWEAHLSEVDALVASVRSHGGVPVVVSHPYTVQFEAQDLWWPQRQIANWCDAKGIPHLDAGKVVAAELTDPLSAYHDGVHPNRKGAALLGDAIAAFLIDQGLVH